MPAMYAQEKESSIGFMVYDWDRMGANDMCGICELPMPLSKVCCKTLASRCRVQVVFVGAQCQPVLFIRW